MAAVMAGILVGHLWPSLGSDLRPVGDGFVRLIKMIIAPLIFCVIVTGIAAVGDVKTVGRIGVKAILYFEFITTFALVFGLAVANVVRPGDGLDIDPATLSTDALDSKTMNGSLPSTSEFLLHTIPESAVDAFARNQLLQVLVFAVFTGVAMATLGRERTPVLFNVVDQFQKVIFKMMGWIMRLAPLGAFGAMAFIIGQYGLNTLATYAKLIAACYTAAVMFTLILAVIARLYAGVSIWKFLRYAREEFLLALGTASTESVLPRIMGKLVDAGCSRAATGLVVPTGYSFNLDGATIYLSICTLFLAQAFGVDLSLGQQLLAVGVLMLTSKGMAGVPGSSFLALSATAAAIGAFPAAGVALLLGADRLMDSMRVFVNLLGNCVATFVVAKSEGQLDREKYAAAMSRTAGGGPVLAPRSRRG
ncbi:cation:dicarboxylase symporter family transporter [Lentzea sp. HUAS12]|nr:cation:dicarboxylase symporter family transporter [Lentzea sp. HUAS12]